MSKRPISDGYRRWLIDEVQAWRDAAILSPDQPERILALYESDDEIAERRHSWAMFALTSVAALLVGLAALLLIGYNWDAMPKPAKLAVIFGVIAGTYAAGFWLRYVRGAPRLSEVVLFLGCFFYGCGIWLVAQVFNIQGHYPNAFWIWAVGTLPFALCVDTLLLHALLVAELAAWIGCEILGFGGAFWFWRFPDACWTLPLFAVPGLGWAYRKHSPVTAALYVALVAWWVILQPLVWQSSQTIVFFVGAAGALLLAFAACHRRGDPMAASYSLFGIPLSGGALAVLSFADVLLDLLRDRSDLSGHAPTFLSNAGVAAIIGVGGILAIVLADAWTHRRGAPDPAAPPIDAGAIARRQWMPVCLMVLWAAVCLWVGVLGTRGLAAGAIPQASDRWSPAVLVPAVAVNAMMVAFAIWLIRGGLYDERGSRFSTGVLLFLLWAVLRYADLFADVGGMLGASLMFFVCGAALFGMVQLWSHRKELKHV